MKVKDFIKIKYKEYLKKNNLEDNKENWEEFGKQKYDSLL